MNFSALREDAVGAVASLTITRIYALVQFLLTYSCSKTWIQFIKSCLSKEISYTINMCKQDTIFYLVLLWELLLIIVQLTIHKIDFTLKAGTKNVGIIIFLQYIYLVNNKFKSFTSSYFWVHTLKSCEFIIFSLEKNLFFINFKSIFEQDEEHVRIQPQQIRFYPHKTWWCRPLSGISI